MMIRILTTLFVLTLAPFASAQTMAGPLRVSTANPRYFTDDSGKEIYLTGSHTWEVLRDSGLYVGIMLFDGYGLQFCRTANDGHPFDGANNTNGISPASNTLTLDNPAALAVQKAYVRKMVDTVNDLDNVLYEIANEAGVGSTAWQFEMIETLNQHQTSKPRRHPVGMTYQNAGGDNATLFASAADWISPGVSAPGGGAVPYGSNPPAADGRKVLLSDTDHIWGISPGADSNWVWRSFTRGLNPIYMDPLDGDPAHPGVRRAMGQTLNHARRLDLINTTPRGDLTSTAHCLANPGSEYLVYQPGTGAFNINLGATAVTYRVEWFRPEVCRKSIR